MSLHQSVYVYLKNIHGIVQNDYMIDRRLLILRAVAHHGTITAAAEAMRLTPSAVSHQLRQLARELNVELLEPRGRNVVLTPAATTLLEHTDTLLADWEAARAALSAHIAGQAGRLRLAGFSTAAAALLVPAAARLTQTHPQLEVQLTETEPAACFAALLSEQADIAVVVVTPDLPPATDPAFDQQPLLDDPLDLLVPAEHRLAGRASVPLAEAARESWIVGTPGGSYHQLVHVACSAAGFAPDIVHYATEWDTGAALVAAGLGVALVPRLAQLPPHPVVRVPLRGDPSPARHILTSIRAGSGDQPAIAAGLHALHTIAHS